VQGLSDKHRLREELIRNLRGDKTPITVPADSTTDLEIVRFLYEERARGELLAELDATVAAPLRALSDDIHQFLDRFYEPRLDDPIAKGRARRDRDRGVASLIADVAADAFRERESDLEFLDRFLGDLSGAGPRHRFSWTLLTGPGGQGKTRLAIEFLARAKRHGFHHAGFLPMAELVPGRSAQTIDPRRWRPRWATLLVIDYPSQAPEAVADLLSAFASVAAQEADGYGFPVRVLLLERQAEGEWWKTLVPATGDGELVKDFAFRPSAERIDHPVSPLSRDALLAIMRGRLGNLPVRDEGLWDALVRVDPNPLAAGADGRFAPRPLFAAAAAQAVADLSRGGESVDSLLGSLGRQGVLKYILDREREHFWKPGAAGRALELHENLLLVATMALGLSRDRLETGLPGFVRPYLPSLDVFEPDRYQRMAGGDPDSELRRLEPDILGEYFVLTRLQSLRSGGARQALIDAGLELGGDEAGVFLIRCALDFPDAWRALDHCVPTRSAAARAFAAAAVDLAGALPTERFDDLDAIVSQTEALALEFDDVELERRKPWRWSTRGAGSASFSAARKRSRSTTRSFRGTAT